MALSIFIQLRTTQSILGKPLFSPCPGYGTWKPTWGLGCSVPWWKEGKASVSKSFQILCPFLLLPFQCCGLSTNTEFPLHLRNGFPRIKDFLLASLNCKKEHWKVIHSPLCKPFLCMFDTEAWASSSIFDLDLPFLFPTPSSRGVVNYYSSWGLPLSWCKNLALLLGRDDTNWEQHTS